MKLVKIKDLTCGMILVRSIFNADGQDILSAGSELNKLRIERLVSLGIDEVYIKDDVLTEDILDEAIRKKTVSIVKKTFESTSELLSDEYATKITEIVDEILNELLENPHLMMNLKDVKMFDEYTYFHSVNVMIVSLICGIGLNLEKDELLELGISALLHDIGKTLVPTEILNNPTQLSEEEFNVMKKHSQTGFDMLKPSTILSEKTKLGILDHHEKYDGSGYPNGKKGTEISLFGRIISAADVYDALTSKRVYKKAILTSEAIEYIYSCAGTVFDPEVVKVFITYIMPFPIGTFVKLSDSTLGQVVENHKELPYRPKVKVVFKGNKPVSPYYVDLLKDHNFLNVTITEVVETIS